MTTTETSKLKGRVLRNLLRQGGAMPEGVLGLYVQVKVSGLEPVVESLKRAGLVRFEPTGHGRSRRVILTEDGIKVAERAKAELNRQTQKQAETAE